MADARIADFMIDGLGARGDGVAHAPQLIHVSGALPGERVRASIDGERGTLIDVIAPGADRATPICAYFGACGGCAAQHMAPGLYAHWKRQNVVDALIHARLEVEVGALIDAHGNGRRRATFHARFQHDGAFEVGYMRAHSHMLIAIAACPILSPAMDAALPAANAIASALRGTARPLDILVTATLDGLDVDVRGAGPPDDSTRRRLVELAGRLDLARLSNHGEILVERRAPRIACGAAFVTPPPGGFLQATEEGERQIAERVLSAVAGARRVADLFSGAGAFALRLAARSDVHAVEIDDKALAALLRAARTSSGLRAVSGENRDLFQRPLSATDLARFDAIVFDPPRAGAEAQARELAKSAVATVVAVSCQPSTLARDLRTLVDGGYRLESVTPIDQFRFSPHAETVAVLRGAASRARKKGLLG
jgi:23S rRNA (uracil1939-C5)-methyltransferase